MFIWIRDFIWPTLVSGIINLGNIILLIYTVILGLRQLKRYREVELTSISILFVEISG